MFIYTTHRQKHTTHHIPHSAALPITLHLISLAKRHCVAIYIFFFPHCLLLCFVQFSSIFVLALALALVRALALALALALTSPVRALSCCCCCLSTERLLCICMYECVLSAPHHLLSPHIALCLARSLHFGTGSSSRSNCLKFKQNALHRKKTHTHTHIYSYTEKEYAPTHIHSTHLYCMHSLSIFFILSHSTLILLCLLSVTAQYTNIKGEKKSTHNNNNNNDNL